MSEQAVGPLEVPTSARVGAAPSALADLGAEIARLEDELRDLERRRGEAEQRREIEDPASPLANRSTELGVSLAQDILRRGRADIRDLLVQAREAADARTDAALREAMGILGEARAEVAEAMGDRAGGVEAVLLDPQVLLPVALAGIVVGSGEDPHHPRITQSPPSTGPASDTSVDPATPVPCVRWGDLPAPPDPNEGPTEADAEGFADFGRPDPADPFVGDTPATTSVPKDALVDLGASEASSSPLPSLDVGSDGDVGSRQDGELAARMVDIAPSESFWGEQEAARRSRWLRPLEILVPMVVALVLFVVLLLWVG